MKIKLLVIFAFLCSSCLSQNTGLDFTDTDSNYIITPHVAGVYPLNNFTIEFWLRNSKTSSPQSLLQKGKCSGSKTSWHLQLRDDNTLDFNFDTDGSCSTINSYKCDSVLAWGVCYHIAITYSAAGVQIYYDGQPQTGSYTSGGYSGNLYSTTEPLRIGTYLFLNGTLGNWLNGMLDEIRIWNRVLTQSEIQANYMLPLIGNENGLVLYYKLDENISGPSDVVYNYATSTGAQLNGLTYSTGTATPVSYNSCFIYTSIANTDNFQLKLFPNPSRNILTIDIESPVKPNEKYNVEISDVSGKIVFFKSDYFPMIIENNNFPKGLYLIKVYNSNIFNLSKVIFD